MKKNLLFSIDFQSRAFNVSLALALGTTFLSFLLEATRNAYSFGFMLTSLALAPKVNASVDLETYVNKVVDGANELSYQPLPFSSTLLGLVALFLFTLALTLVSDRARIFHTFHALPESIQERIRTNLGKKYLGYRIGKSDVAPVVRIGFRQISIPPSVVLGSLKGEKDSIKVLEHEYTHAYAADPLFSVVFRVFRIGLFFPLFFLGLMIGMIPFITLEILGIYENTGYLDDAFSIGCMILTIVMISALLKSQRNQFYSAKEEFADAIPSAGRKNGTSVVLGVCVQCVLYTSLNGPPSVELSIFCLSCLIFSALLVAPPSALQITITSISIVIFSAFYGAITLVDIHLFDPVSVAMPGVGEVVSTMFFPLAVLLVVFVPTARCWLTRGP